MVRTLLVRGMLVGLVAGLLVFGFSKVFGEPPIDRAIAFEAAAEEAKPHTHAQSADSHVTASAEPELVSRSVQSTYGLFVGVVVYCAAFGGLFALVFAFANGRVPGLGPRATAALLAFGGFIAVHVVPALKYPANPPAVGDAETIGYRTALYFVMMAVSIAALVGAVALRQRLLSRLEPWPAALTAAAAYVAVVGTAQLILPRINEVPDGFPASLLWDFRIAAIGMQFVMWAAIGLLFGWLTERSLAGHRNFVIARAARI